ncbi:MFS transporter [Agromyces sp. MMS24-K17]|uniref:MFS transporter n=1 Tax=Agromyces sp. MMS24-K17 TaxID=3372850 RepID=UPI0037551F32
MSLRTAVTGFSPLMDVLAAELGFGPALIGAFGTIVAASFAVFGFVTPLVSRRLGLEWTLVGAAAIAGAGVVLRATSDSPAMLVATTIVALAGVGASNVLIVPMVKTYFASRLKAMSSLYLGLLQLGQFTAPLVAVPLALSFGWRAALAVWAIPWAVAVAMWLVTALRARDHDAATRPEASAGERIVGAWRTPLLWSLVVLFGMTALHTYSIITWLPTILVDAGADPALGGTLLAIFSVFGVLAAFVVPRLTIALRNPVAVVLVCAALLAVGYAGLLVAPLEGALVWVTALGLGVSTFPLCLTLVNVRTRTTSGAALLSGAMQGLGYGIACLGPLSIGWLLTLTGSWTSSFVLLFAAVVVTAVSGLVACRPGNLEDAAAQRAGRRQPEPERVEVG